jgi:hypothetical protein
LNCLKNRYGTMRYHPPHSITNPRRYIRSVHILHDSGPDGFSLATIDWEGTPHIGIRWNVAHKERTDAQKISGSVVCHGAPAPNGVPSWFILPRELFDPALFHADNAALLSLAQAGLAGQ